MIQTARNRLPISWNGSVLTHCLVSLSNADTAFLVFVRETLYGVIAQFRDKSAQCVVICPDAKVSVE